MLKSRAPMRQVIRLVVAIFGAACASGPDPKPDPVPGTRVTDVAVVSAFRGSRPEVAARVTELVRRKGYVVTPDGEGPATLLLGPFEFRGCRVTYQLTFSAISPDPRVLLYLRGTYIGKEGGPIRRVYAQSGGCGGPAWDRLQQLALDLYAKKGGQPS